MSDEQDWAENRATELANELQYRALLQDGQGTSEDDYAGIAADENRIARDVANLVAAALREARAEAMREIAPVALAYEALLMDTPSRKWIAPEIWEVIEQGVTAFRRALLAAEPAGEKEQDGKE